MKNENKENLRIEHHLDFLDKLCVEQPFFKYTLFILNEAHGIKYKYVTVTFAPITNPNWKRIKYFSRDLGLQEITNKIIQREITAMHAHSRVQRNQNFWTSSARNVLIRSSDQAFYVILARSTRTTTCRL